MMNIKDITFDFSKITIGDMFRMMELEIKKQKAGYVIALLPIIQKCASVDIWTLPMDQVAQLIVEFNNQLVAYSKKNQIENDNSGIDRDVINMLKKLLGEQDDETNV